MIHQRFISQRHLYQSPNPKSIALDLVDSGEMHYSNSSRHFDRCIGFTTAYVTPKVGGHYAAHQSMLGVTASDLYQHHSAEPANITTDSDCDHDTAAPGRLKRIQSHYPR
jgi:hypothetical protein